ncbi:hypothetical protein [Azotobacter beijerinckii]|uniref:hypothetical protein n=1 Tax=Azotobacter beijerinckii TaxID=170623 RepID=UPI0011139633|nr:hypothetical protein [Azotobacter beijerinckii]
MGSEVFKDEINQLIPKLVEFFDRKGFYGITESIDPKTGFPKLHALPRDGAFSLSFSYVEYFDKERDEYRMNYSKPVGWNGTVPGDGTFTVRYENGYLKISSKGRDYRYNDLDIDDFLEDVYGD